MAQTIQHLTYCLYTSHHPALGGVKGALPFCHHCLDPTSGQKIQNLFRGETPEVYICEKLFHEIPVIDQVWEPLIWQQQDRNTCASTSKEGGAQYG